MESMRNSYVEHLVKRKDPSYWMLLKIVSYVFLVLALFIAFAQVLGLIVLAVAAIVVYFVHLYSSVEYEYLYIEGSFSVDEVLNKSRRRKIVDTNTGELVMIAPKGSDSAKSELNSSVRVMDVSGDCPANKKYCYIYQRNGERRCLFIEMTDELLREVRHYAPQKVKMQ